eukprot:CAMPEP_0172533752 /NCGR_PEP_ID=MMETSP1067-20121228/6340_1 /TAXON_ID=265564 ORGANISM="Thalassiosira punctigera, Strain Tpunct2005C2" /NCGR_SAMPLE_ID=MMETSP1067 /ASSEMBLY_ACC=CAM_ASM_000444 /LENGTH=437 /DNA_ID=CAMNT_0013318427 /DNA_START=299 /DNA_END=1609 /DNA_ORIENTATION=-
MASTADAVAIDKMVRAKFDAYPLDALVSQPTIASCRHMTEQIAEICAAFKTTQWGCRHGNLKLALGIKKCKAVIGDTNMAERNVLDKPSAATTTFVDGDDSNTVEQKKAEHKVLWWDYEPQEAIKAMGIKAIVKAVEEQYVQQLKQDYIGFTRVSIFSVLEHLRLWYTITNEQKIAIKKQFFAPWSETPDVHVKTYRAQLDRRQIECGNLDVTISDNNKVLHFVGEMENSGLFTCKFLDKMEDSGAVDWVTTVKNWSKEFDKIGRGRERAAERKREGYSSAAAVTQQPAPSNNGTVVAILEYAAALESRLNDLQGLVDNQSTLTAGTETVAATIAVATAATSRSELAELKAVNASLVKEQATTQAQLAALMVKMSALTLGPEGSGGGGTVVVPAPKKPRHGRRGRKLAFCLNCKREVYHKLALCMELEENAGLRYPG